MPRRARLLCLAPLFLLAALASAACEEGADGPSPSAPDAARPDGATGPIDAGLPDAARAPEHCDSVMYWCEGGRVYQGYISHETSPGCAGYACSTCSAASPGLWSSFQAVGDCASGCRAADAGPSCEYWDAIGGGMTGSYPEDALAELCAP